MRVAERQQQTARPILPVERTDLPLVAPGVTFRSLTGRVVANVLQPDVPLFWFWCYLAAIAAACVFSTALAIVLDVGIGVMGNNIPVAWVFPIANYVWWIEIAVGGSLLSSILRLTNQGWRSSINRIAESVTLAGIVCAGLFPIIHLGRSWVAYWTLPYPNTMIIQPNFRSPLVWDVFGIGTYALASVLFWYMDLLPDLATMRDHATSRISYFLYGLLSLGWSGASHHWRLHERAGLLLAGILTPLVFTVHTVVSFDFCISLVPGWHSTIFPPYFVTGAILAGISMVALMTTWVRSSFRLTSIITERHLNNLSKLILTTSVIMAYVYVFEPFINWYSGNYFDIYSTYVRSAGNFAWTYWAFILLGLGVPQLLWWKKNRITPRRLFVIALLIVIGMWLERYMLMVTSLSRDYLPSYWANFAATGADNALLYGSIGLFLCIFLLLIRALPMIPMYEIRMLLPLSKPGGGSVK
ncbi:MAG TPA: NrfD/PsrC family molybdoenzyme membrane anchor subunit [Bryobacteraceae bacterium]|nr:NrfD/PsrC family molybdoenzyme membrane anchor subunit [Bryobacteraceae bacterium]